MPADDDTFTTICADTEATLDLGARVAAALLAARVPELLIDLRGDLGAGKTVFVRGLAWGLGVPRTQRIVSPTFTIARAYAVPAGALRELHHLDAYRLGGAADLESVGFEAMCGIGCVTCVEWGENVEEALPVDRLRVTLVPLADVAADDDQGAQAPRQVVFAALGARARAVVGALRTLPATRHAEDA